MEPAGRRRNSVRVTDELIFAAMSTELSSGGIDALSATGIARSAGVTVGAIYSRAESISELANTLWVDVIGEPFLTALELVVRSSREDDAADFDKAIRRFDTAMRSAAPAIELVIASLFDPELDEVVGAEMRRRFTDLIFTADRSATPVESASAVLILSYFCGRAITRCRVSRMPRPGQPGQDALQAFWEVRSGRIAQTEPAVIEFAREPTSKPHSTIAGATVDVIARHGFRRGTIARIARTAGVTPGAVLSTGESKIDLMIRSVDEILLSPREAWDAYVATRTSVISGSDRASFVAGLLEPANSTYWRINLELARLAEKMPEFGRFRTPNDVLQQTHQGVMFVGCFVNDIHRLPFAVPFRAGSAT